MRHRLVRIRLALGRPAQMVGNFSRRLASAHARQAPPKDGAETDPGTDATTPTPETAGLDLAGLHGSVLALPDMGVADLYLDLAVVRAQRAQTEFAGRPASTVLAQAAECLSEGVAYLCDSAEQLLHPAGARHERLELLAMALLAEAAGFEHSADLLRAAEGRGDHQS